MSFSTTNDTLTITVPQIPYLSTFPLSVSVPTSSLRTLMRLVVIIATYLLFRPQLEKLFRRLLGNEDPAKPQSVEGLQRRMKELEDERGQPIGGGRKVAVVTSSGNATTGGSGQTPKARKKA